MWLDAGGRDGRKVRKRYAVIFCEQGGQVAAGALELGDDQLVLVGTAEQRECALSLPFADIAEVRIGRLPVDRLNGHVTLVLECGGRPDVRVAPLGAGLLHEIADLVSALASEQRGGDELAVVVPLKPNSLARARELLEGGAPLDPAALGLVSHQVYLQEGEAVFVFRGPNVSARVGKAMRSPALWRAGLAWQECIDGRPVVHRSAEMLSSEAMPVYSWVAPDGPGAS